LYRDVNRKIQNLFLSPLDHRADGTTISTVLYLFDQAEVREVDGWSGTSIGETMAGKSPHLLRGEGLSRLPSR
jgi:hypothetical protein